MRLVIIEQIATGVVQADTPTLVRGSHITGYHIIGTVEEFKAAVLVLESVVPPAGAAGDSPIPRSSASRFTHTHAFSDGAVADVIEQDAATLGIVEATIYIQKGIIGLSIARNIFVLSYFVNKLAEPGDTP